MPTNGVNVFTVFETIRGLWECYDRRMTSLFTRAPPGSWLLDPLAPQSSQRSLVQSLVETRAAGRRPRRFHNMTVGTPTAKLDSRHGNIFATLRVVGESAAPATATIRTTTRNSNIVLELVRQFVPLPM